MRVTETTGGGGTEGERVADIAGASQDTDRDTDHEGVCEGVVLPSEGDTEGVVLPSGGDTEWVVLPSGEDTEGVVLPSGGDTAGGGDSGEWARSGGGGVYGL